MSRWARILVWGAAILGGIVTYWLFLGPQTIFCLSARWWIYRNDPVEWITPTRLVDRSITQSVGVKETYAGYEFEVPWKDIYQERSVRSWKVIVFRSGKKIVLSRFPPKERVDMMLKPFGGDTKVAQILGEQPFGSDFAFAKAILDTTPNKLTLLTPRRELARSWLLLKFKLTTLYGDTGIFVISGKDWQGFQFGDTRATPRTIGDDLYVETGRLEFRFAQGKPDSGMISQSDINRVIQSVHIVRSAPKGPPGSAMK